MNLDDFRLNDAALVMCVRHPVTGEDTDTSLLLLSPYDAAFLKRKNDIARDGLYRAMNSADGPDIELRLTAAAIAGWRGLSCDGMEMVYSSEASERLLTEYPWLREQVVFFTTMPRSFSKCLRKTDCLC